MVCVRTENKRKEQVTKISLLIGIIVNIFCSMHPLSKENDKYLPWRFIQKSCPKAFKDNTLHFNRDSEVPVQFSVLKITF